MSIQKDNTAKVTWINKISKEVIAQWPDKVSLLKAFIRCYFANISVHDLQVYTVEQWVCVVKDHLDMLEQTSGDEVGIRIFNPGQVYKDWPLQRTVIMMVYRDMPFLVDSVRMLINRYQCQSYLIVDLGGIHVERDAKKHILAVQSTTARSHPKTEMWSQQAPIFIELNRKLPTEKCVKLHKELENVLHDVRCAVEDWPTMCKKLDQASEQFECLASSDPTHHYKEVKSFIHDWLPKHFIFLGYRYYKIKNSRKEYILENQSQSGLGVLRTSKRSANKYFSKSEVEEFMSSNQIIIFSKTKSHSTVHRPGYTDFIAIKALDAQQKRVVGEHHFVGLYTSDAYSKDIEDIPLLRRKLQYILRQSGFNLNGYTGHKLKHVVKNLPRDELFQAESHELFDLSMSILSLEKQERRRVSLFLRKDPRNRFFSCLVFLPKDYFNTRLLLKIRNLLFETFQGTDIYFTPTFSDSVFVRIHYVVRVDPKKPKLTYSHQVLEQRLLAIAYPWRDGFLDHLRAHFGDHEGDDLFNRYSHAFSVGYRDTFSPKHAVDDVSYLEQVSVDKPLMTKFYKPKSNKKDILRLKLFRFEHSTPLSETLPMLENMGMNVREETSYKVVLSDERTMWINDFILSMDGEAWVEDFSICTLFHEAFYEVWIGRLAENDGFNRLVVSAYLSWRQVSVLRAYGRYLKQIQLPFSLQYMQEALWKNPKSATLLIDFFENRFDTHRKDKGRQETADEIEKAFVASLESVMSLDHDRILRAYLEVISATVRTNFYQRHTTGSYKTRLSFKLLPEKISNIPLPCPKYEIFVYSPIVEGVHLRMHKIARGGLRWSDRLEDFRTEILGLMKAQQVKNTVIIPSGAKGGFVCRKLSPVTHRQMLMEQGKTCYREFIRGLLDVTDHSTEEKFSHPSDTRCYDDQDAYLVVAADKGTATFSDVANAISVNEYKFWLADAFASGGSTGYDHKQIGITARGAWKSVERHFHELNMDISQPFTVVGIGDMSGDVFGNGMLLSRQIKLVGAFNHLHIFIDPDPDPEISFCERRRLFLLPNSTWSDYNPEYLSQGGGIFSRSVKSIPLTPVMKRWLTTDKESVSPHELIRLLLTAKVDLLFNGGIGTYVKAREETHDMVSDHANDAVRVNGRDLLCRVVVEGGNLGFTQLGRVEYELGGGCINTDFIDNSSGVDCSDHEVNIKILLSSLLEQGILTMKQRNQLLKEMTEEVADLVLAHNEQQNMALSLSARQTSKYIELYDRYITEWEHAGRLSRSLEYLPSSELLQERKAAGLGLTRPELAILMAYTKIMLKEDILNSHLPEDAYLASCVDIAFPSALKKRYSDQISQHPLRREMIATQLSNRVINEMGVTFVRQMCDEMNLTTSDVIKAYVIASEIFDRSSWCQQVSDLNGNLKFSDRLNMILDINTLLRRSSRWLLRHRLNQLDIEKTVDHFSDAAQQLTTLLPKQLTGLTRRRYEAKKKRWLKLNLPQDFANQLAAVTSLHVILSITSAAHAASQPVAIAVDIYSPLVEYLDLVWLERQINDYPIAGRWSVLARASVKYDLSRHIEQLLVDVLKTRGYSSQTKLALWYKNHQDWIVRWRLTIEKLKSYNHVEFTMLSVVIRELAEFIAFMEHVKK